MATPPVMLLPAFLPHDCLSVPPQNVRCCMCIASAALQDAGQERAHATDAGAQGSLDPPVALAALCWGCVW